MQTEKLKSNKPRESQEYLFRPIQSNTDLLHQRKPPSPLQTGLKYLKLLGQSKRQVDSANYEPPQRPARSAFLQRTLPFSTNYYAPSASLSSRGLNKSIQVDDFDDLSFKTAISIPESPLSISEFSLSFLSLLLFILILLYFQLNSRPIHCLLHDQFWYPIDLTQGIRCNETDQIEIHHVQIFETIYQLEIHRNIRAKTCLGFDILSCLPLNNASIPKNRLIVRHDYLSRYCQKTEKILCQSQFFTIAPKETKWNLHNDQSSVLRHCSCSISSSNNPSSCFRWTMNDRCDLHIPWFDYCLKQSTDQFTCHAYLARM